MRIVGSYVGAVVVSVTIAVGLLLVGFVDPSAPRDMLQLPASLVAYSPDLAIRTRHIGTFFASAGPEVLLPLKIVAAILVFGIADLAGLVFFEMSDAAWRGVRFWEGSKPFWAAVIFTALGSTLYMAALLWQAPLVPRFALPPIGFALAALAGGLAFGLGLPRHQPVATAPAGSAGGAARVDPAAATQVLEIRAASAGIVRTPRKVT